MAPENNPAVADLGSKAVLAPEDSWTSISGLPCQLSVDLSIAGFKVRDLLALEIETVIASQSSATGPVPLWVNGAKLARAEFDILGTRLAIRISELE
ncbi:MAG: FliM/FliN family flagellar motor switch protein [Terriglobia bacterium]